VGEVEAQRSRGRKSRCRESYVGAALADAACRSGYRAIFVRVPRLLEELALARASGAYASLLGKLSRIDALVLDDFLLNPMTDIERRDLLEVVEDRDDKTSTVITTQMPEHRPATRAERFRATFEVINLQSACCSVLCGSPCVLAQVKECSTQGLIAIPWSR
jgi:hypothetical protein